MSGEILKLGGEAMNPYVARLLDITLNNGTLPADWRRAVVVPVHKGGDRLLVTNYRPVNLTSVLSKPAKSAQVFLGFPLSVYKLMLRWFPELQVATACFSCSPPDIKFLAPFS